MRRLTQPTPTSRAARCAWIRFAAARTVELLYLGTSGKEDAKLMAAALLPRLTPRRSSYWRTIPRRRGRGSPRAPRTKVEPRAGVLITTLASVCMEAGFSCRREHPAAFLCVSPVIPGVVGCAEGEEGEGRDPRADRQRCRCGTCGIPPHAVVVPQRSLWPVDHVGSAYRKGLRRHSQPTRRTSGPSGQSQPRPALRRTGLPRSFVTSKNGATAVTGQQRATTVVTPILCPPTGGGGCRGSGSRADRRCRGHRRGRPVRCRCRCGGSCAHRLRAVEPFGSCPAPRGSHGIGARSFLVRCRHVR